MSLWNGQVALNSMIVLMNHQMQSRVKASGVKRYSSNTANGRTFAHVRIAYLHLQCHFGHK